MLEQTLGFIDVPMGVTLTIRERRLAGLLTKSITRLVERRCDESRIRASGCGNGGVPVRGRFVAGALTASVLVASCSEKVPQKTARITVDNKTRTSHAISCSQVQWLLTADISAAPARVQVVLKLGPQKPEPESVNIENFEGFTGVADAGVGHAEAVFAGDTYTITGEAQGSKRDDPSISTTAPFKIEVGC